MCKSGPGGTIIASSYDHTTGILDHLIDFLLFPSTTILVYCQVKYNHSCHLSQRLGVCVRESISIHSLIRNPHQSREEWDLCRVKRKKSLANIELQKNCHRHIIAPPHDQIRGANCLEFYCCKQLEVGGGQWWINNIPLPCLHCRQWQHLWQLFPLHPFIKSAN